MRLNPYLTYVDEMIENEFDQPSIFDSLVEKLYMDRKIRVATPTKGQADAIAAFIDARQDHWTATAGHRLLASAA